MITNSSPENAAPQTPDGKKANDGKIYTTLYRDGLKTQENKKKEPPNPYTFKPSIEEGSMAIIKNMNRVKDLFFQAETEGHKPQKVEEFDYKPHLPQHSVEIMAASNDYNYKLKEKQRVMEWVTKTKESRDERLNIEKKTINFQEDVAFTPKKRSRERIQMLQKMGGDLL